MPERLWNPSYVAMIVSNTLMATGFMMVIPILPKFALTLGASLTLAGVIAGLFSITALVFRPVAGVLTDRLNMKAVALWATVGLAVATLGYSLSGSVGSLFLFRLAHGAVFAVAGTASNSLGTAFIPAKRLGEGIGYLGLGFILASALGPNLGLELSARFGYPLAFRVAFVLLLAGALVIATVRYQPAAGKKTQRRRLPALSELVALELAPLVLIVAAFSFTNGLIGAFIALVGEQRGFASVGIYFVTNAIVLLASRPLAGRLVDARGLGFVLVPAFVCAAAATTLIAFASGLWMLAIAGALYAAGSGSSQPALQTSCIRELGPARTGVAMSTFFIGADVGQGLGPIVGGAIAGRFGYTVLFLVGTALLLAGLAFWLLRGRPAAAVDPLPVEP